MFYKKHLFTPVARGVLRERYIIKELGFFLRPKPPMFSLKHTKSLIHLPENKVSHNFAEWTNEIIHQWIFPCKYSITTNTCSFLQLAQKSIQLLSATVSSHTDKYYLWSTDLPAQHHSVYWLSSFPVPCRTISLKSIHLIDVLKLSFSAAVTVWTNIEKLLMLLRKRSIHKYPS